MKSDQTVGQIIKKWADDFNLNAEYFKTLGSTNDYARKSKASLIIADAQTSGRGRGHNQWICPQYGAYFLTTWILRPPIHPQPLFSPLTGLALYQALQKTWPLKSLSLKAPNDIYIEDQKLAGILIETLSQSGHTKVLIGIGINMRSYPLSLQATSLAQSDQPVNENHIRCFLSYLWQQLSELASEASDLSLKKRQAILKALNQHPSKQGQNKYTEVLPCGSLRTNKGIIPWYTI